MDRHTEIIKGNIICIYEDQTPRPSMVDVLTKIDAREFVLNIGHYNPSEITITVDFTKE